MLRLGAKPGAKPRRDSILFDFAQMLLVRQPDGNVVTVEINGEFVGARGFESPLPRRPVSRSVAKTRWSERCGRQQATLRDVSRRVLLRGELGPVLGVMCKHGPDRYRTLVVAASVPVARSRSPDTRLA